MQYSQAALESLRTSTQSVRGLFSPQRILNADNEQETQRQPSIMDPTNDSDLSFPMEVNPQQDAPPVPPLNDSNDNISNDNISNASNNYHMTSSDDNSANTNTLLATIERLTHELQLERDNNAAINDNMHYQNERHENDMASLQREIQRLQQSTTTTPPTPAPTTTPSTNTIDPVILELLRQQQAMMTTHMSENNKILSAFGEGIESLKNAALKSAEAAEKQTEETINARNKKGPTNSRFPKFQAKPDKNFADWYDDILAILSLKEWRELCNTSNDDAYESTTPETEQLSEHLYCSLRQALQGNAGTIMKTNEQLHQNKGLEYFHSMKEIFHDKWADTEHGIKMSEYYQFFRTPQMTINDYATKFRRLLRELKYNGVSISSTAAAKQFIIGLGPEFIPIRNMSTLPTEFQTENLNELTKAARDHLKRVKGNRTLQQQQRTLLRGQQSPTDPPPNPRPGNPQQQQWQQVPPNGHPPATPNGRPDPPPMEDWQKEIMREIGFHCHTPDRKSYWQSLTQPNYCYFHRNSTHTSAGCYRMNNAITRASTGTPPSSPFVPNYRFRQTPSPQPPTTPAPAPAPPRNPYQRHGQAPAPSPAPAPLPSPAPSPAQPNPPPIGRHVSSTQGVDDNSEGGIVDINTYSADADYYPRASLYYSPSTPLSYYKFIVDSGATQHMCNERSLFTTFQEINSEHSYVKLGDGKQKCLIKGTGTIQYSINNKTIRLHDVLYVPALDVSLYSVKLHMKIQGCYEHCEDNVCTLAYPTFSFDATTDHEISFNAKPCTTPPDKDTDFDNSKSTMNIKNQHIPYHHTANTPSTISISSTFKTRALKHVPTKSTPDSAGYNLYSAINTSIPPQSRKAISLGFNIAIPPGLYGRIAPRSGLALKQGIDVAAGVIDPDYRGEVKAVLVNTSQKKFTIKEGDKIAQLIFKKCASPAFRVLRDLNQTERGSGGFGSTDTARTTSTPLEDTTTSTPHIIPPDDSEISPPSPTDQDIQNSSTPPLVQDPPQIRPIDKPQDVDPESKTVSVDELRKLLGYRNTENVIDHLKTCFKKTFTISNIDREPTLDLGEVATIDKTNIPTQHVQLPKNFGDVMHVDIGYGCNAGLNGIKYALFVVDRATRYKYIYELKSLQDDILPAFQSLVKDMGFAPKKIMTDFDHKLLGAKVRQYFTPLKTKIESAPPRMQHKNGLVERNWRSIVRMARSWLTSALLPSSFWFYAVKRAVEASNYLPIKLNGEQTTPFEIVHHEQPDIQALIPLFSIAYIDHPNSGTTATPSISSQSLRVILIGKSQHSTALEFYHPPTKQTYTSSVYKLDPTLAAGPLFNLHYDGGLFFNTYHNEADFHIAPTFTPDQIVYFQPKEDEEKYVQGKILGIPLDPKDNIFTLQRHDNHNIIQMPSSRILPYNPTAIPDNDINIRDNTLPSWIKQNAPATLFLDTMPKPRRGLLKMHADNEWYFHFGRNNRTDPIHLLHFHRDALDLIQKSHLIRGHPTFSKIYQDRQSQLFQESVARHVSAATLKSLDIPTLMQMHSMENHDKELWKAAYDEEYEGLTKLPAWIQISDKEYQKLRPIVGNAMPTMAISTIKYDENGKPKRVKWRIVALGNLDPHEWTSNQCYAPVLSMLEIRLLTSLAVHHKRTLKNADFKQAFVQAVLPDDEKYVLRPPPGCPNTPKDTYWLLKRTLYGLKRSPRHWFHKATLLLEQCGLTPTKNNPCLFSGKPDGKNTLYLGLYVDDICYFSESPECEKFFENKLKSITTVDFMGDASHFLGIKFQWTKHENGELDAYLSQEAFAEQVVESNRLTDANSVKTPYRSGHPVDSVATSNISDEERGRLASQLRSMVGSILWLSQGTRPDLSTIVSMLAQYQANPSYGHIRAAKHVIRYIKGTKNLGLKFSSQNNTSLQAFMNFPLPTNKLLTLTDANWGGQDQGHNRTSITELERFKTRSMSGFIIFFNGPLTWSSRRQKVTARSSAEAEIYATDECVKELLRLKHMCYDLGIMHIFMPGTDPINVYNDNNACVCWSKALTTKGLRHITIRENAIRESVDDDFIRVLHIDGKINLADLFTKEMKDVNHFLTLRSYIVSETPKPKINERLNTSPLSQQRIEGGIENDGQTRRSLTTPL